VLFQRTFLPEDASEHPSLKGSETQAAPPQTAKVQADSPAAPGVLSEVGERPAQVQAPGKFTPSEPGEKARELIGIVRPEPVTLNESELAGFGANDSPEVLTLRIAYVQALIVARKPPIWHDMPKTFKREDLCDHAALFHVQDFDRFLHASPAERSHDPLRHFLDVQRDRFAVSVADFDVSTLKQLYTLTEQFSKGGNSGVTQVEVDLVNRAYDSAKVRKTIAESDYRASLESLKDRLGLAGRRIVPDLRTLETFYSKLKVFGEWSRRPGRRIDELETIVASLPSFNQSAFLARRQGSDPDSPATKTLLQHLNDTLARYNHQRNDLVSAYRLRDSISQSIIAPWPASTSSIAVNVNARVNHFLLIGMEEDIGRVWRSIVSLWCESVLTRANLELGMSHPPYRDWEAYFESIERVHAETSTVVSPPPVREIQKAPVTLSPSLSKRPFGGEPAVPPAPHPPATGGDATPVVPSSIPAGDPREDRQEKQSTAAPALDLPDPVFAPSTVEPPERRSRHTPEPRVPTPSAQKAEEEDLRRPSGRSAPGGRSSGP
jgi:hypothetical protein